MLPSFFVYRDVVHLRDEFVNFDVFVYNLFTFKIHYSLKFQSKTITWLALGDGLSLCNFIITAWPSRLVG